MNAPRRCAALAAVGAAALLAACGEQTRLPSQADVGPKPRLTEPNTTLLPTVHIAPASPWPAGTMPVAAPGLVVTPYATGFDHPRWLHLLPNGDLLVAETNGPPRPEDGKGVKGWVMRKLMARAGSNAPSANRITLLRDADGDGKPETRSVFLQQGLDSPFGMALVGNTFYVANTDGVMAWPYNAGQTRIEGAGRVVTDLPGGPINHHWTKSLIASPDGGRLYATVGSNSNVAENGMEAESGRAAIWEIDLASGLKRLYASGLRNPNGMAWTPSPAGTTAQLWVVVNERDELGSDLVPDYLTSVRDGGFYGWPYSWYGTHVDERVQPPKPDLVARALVPDFALGSHVAPLGLAAATDATIPDLLVGHPPSGLPSPAANTAAAPASAASAAAAPTAAASAPAAPAAPVSVAPVRGMFVGEHGSWNRRPYNGYKVVFVPFVDGRPQGLPVDVLTGFVSPDGKAWGRPVGVAVDRHGALLVADDVGGTVWRVAPR